MTKQYPVVPLPLKRRSIANILLPFVATALIVVLLTQVAALSTSASRSLTAGTDAGPSNRNADPVTIAAFKEDLKASHPASYTLSAEGWNSVSFRKNAVYRLHDKTSLQEIVTQNSLIKTMVLHQLDNLGIEYQLTQSPDGNRTVWVISWGGILYFPDL